MLNSIVNLFTSCQRQMQVPLAGLVIIVGVWGGEAKSIPSHIEPKGMSALVVGSQGVGKVAIAKGQLEHSAPTGKLPEKDGTYLYSQSPEPEQIGQEYMVFEVRQGKVIGAIYMPHSEFSCFYGALNSGKLTMMVASSSDSEAYPDPVAGQNTQQVATNSDKPYTGDSNNSVAYPYSVLLQNYHQLNVSANDKRILGTCKTN